MSTPQNESYTPKNVIIKHKVKYANNENTDKNWSSSDTLKPREIGYEYDTGKFKIAPPVEEGEETNDIQWDIIPYAINVGRGIGTGSTVEGNNIPSAASGNYSHAEGKDTVAGVSSNSDEYGMITHAEGDRTQALGNFSHSEGCITKAYGAASHTEGCGTQTGQLDSEVPDSQSGQYAHAEGHTTTAKGEASHTEGSNTEANGANAHAEGESTKAYGANSHAEGIETIANHANSHVSGLGTISTNDNSFVIGKYNSVPENSDYLFVIGNGSEVENGRSNLLTVDNAESALIFNGDITANTFINQDGNHIQFFEHDIIPVWESENVLDNNTVVQPHNLYLSKRKIISTSNSKYRKWEEYFIPTNLKPYLIFITNKSGYINKTFHYPYNGAWTSITYYGGLLINNNDNNDSILYAYNITGDPWDSNGMSYSDLSSIPLNNNSFSIGSSRSTINGSYYSSSSSNVNVKQDSNVYEGFKNNNNYLSISSQPIIRIPNYQINNKYGFFVYIDDSHPCVESACAGNQWIIMGTND